MSAWGKRKDGRTYPKKLKTGKKGTLRPAGKIVPAKGYWAKGDAKFSEFAWSFKAISSIIEKRQKLIAGRFDDLRYTSKVSEKKVTAEYFGTSNGKLVDHFKIKRGSNGLWGIKNLPKKYNFRK